MLIAIICYYYLYIFPNEVLIGNFYFRVSEDSGGR